MLRCDPHLSQTRVLYLFKLDSPGYLIHNQLSNDEKTGFKRGQLTFFRHINQESFPCNSIWHNFCILSDVR
jgi:hypothetical protein